MTHTLPLPGRWCLLVWLVASVCACGWHTTAVAASQVAVRSPGGGHDSLASAALWSLFDATGGPSWNTSWAPGTELCDLAGVTCLSDNFIQVALPRNNLVGTVPATLFCAPGLVYLDLRSNAISGHLEFPTPDQCQTLADASGDVYSATTLSLELLDLSDNHMSGSIPPAVFSDYLPNLTSIFVCGNEFSGRLPPVSSTMVRATHSCIGSHHVARTRVCVAVWYLLLFWAFLLVGLLLCLLG